MKDKLTFEDEDTVAIIALDDGKLAHLDSLESRKAPAAIGTGAAPADRRIVFRRPGVFHLSIVVTTKRTAHGNFLTC